MTSADACSDQTTDPHAGHASEIFEGIGRLYLARYGRLRPGKDDRLHDSMDDENVRQFSWWIKYEALDDAVMQIERQASEIERLRTALWDCRGALWCVKTTLDEQIRNGGMTQLTRTVLAREVDHAEAAIKDAVQAHDDSGPKPEHVR